MTTNKQLIWLFPILLGLFFYPLLSLSQSRIFYENGHEVQFFTQPGKFHFDYDDVWKDDNGQLWMINLEKILRYDGVDFEIFKVDQKNRINNMTRQFSQVFKDSRGYIWATSLGGGIVRYNPWTETYTRVPIDTAFELQSWGSTIVEDAYGGIWTGNNEGLIRITDIDADPFTIEKITMPSMASELEPLVHSLGNPLAAITQVQNQQNRSIPFRLDKQTDLFILAQGELRPQQAAQIGTSGIWLSMLPYEWLDHGWITNEQGSIVWNMQEKPGKTAGKVYKSRLLTEFVSLPPGNYTLHYQTNEHFTFGDWNYAYYEADNDRSPEVPEWWGIQLFEVNASVQNELEELIAHFPQEGSLASEGTHLYKDIRGDIWVYGHSLQRLKIDSDGDYYLEDFFRKDISDSVPLVAKFLDIYSKDQDHLWISGLTIAGNKIIGYLNISSREFTEIKTGLKDKASNERLYILQNSFGQMIQDKQGNLWLGGMYTFGVHCISPPFVSPSDEKPALLKSFTFLNRNSSPSPFARPISGIKTFELDDANNLWIGTWRTHLYKLNLDKSPLEYIDLSSLGFTDDDVLYFQKTEPYTIWISIREKGQLTEYNLETKTAIHHQIDYFKGTQYYPIATWDNRKVLFQSGYNPECYVYDAATQSLKEILIPGLKKTYMSSNSMINDSLLFTMRGQLINIRQYQLAYDMGNYLHGMSSTILYTATTAQDGSFWVVRNSGQIGRFRLDGQELIQMETYDFQEGNNRDIIEDTKGNIWISGIHLATNREKPNFQQTYSEIEGLKNVYHAHLLSDSVGRIWTFNLGGASRFDPATGEVYTPKVLAHLKSRFAYRFQDGSIVMIMQGMGSMYHFHPDSLSKDPYPPRIMFVEFFAAGEEDSVKYSLNWKADLPPISLPHNQNNINISYTGLQYNHPEAITYAYKLKGSRDEWQEVDDERIARFPNLPPASYTFQLKAANSDGTWSEVRSLTFTIRPPWWWSGPAKLCYLLLAGAMLYGLYRFLLNRQLEQAEAQRLKELDQVKTRLYTNITHEFRTPLTVIQGMADKVVEKPDKWLDRGISMIKRNNQKLLRLVNQMLDLAKLESGKLELNLVHADVIPFLYYLVESFHSFAEAQGVDLQMLPELENLEMDYDPDRLTDIASNLLSNAIKFTPEGGHVYISILRNNGSLVLIVKDTGSGIAPDELPHIFDRFYQADDSTTRQGEGTGIGLALTRELVQLMGGSIQASSRPGAGSTFTVVLPIRKKASLHEHVFKGATAIKNLVVANQGEAMPFVDQVAGENLPHILLIEDNTDVVSYLMSCLEADYRISVAHDGEEGIQKALEMVPDMIISDVMMPMKDGFEVCYALKNDIRTSHIPVILLTAKADVASKLTGLRRGADAYLTKPFNEEELLLRIENLLELRKQLQQRYTSTDQTFQEKLVESNEELKLEDTFIHHFRSFVMENLDNYDLDVEMLCREMGMSRSALHNKLKALTDMSTTEFVRFIRLSKACDWLTSTELNISEIAYKTGFQNPPYFTRVFGDLYGMSPKEYRERNAYPSADS